MIENNRNNEQIYGRNDMIMLDPNNKIYGSLGIADNYVMKTEEGTRLVLSNPKPGKFGDVLTEFNMYGRSEQFSTTGAQLFNENIEIKSRGVTIKINGSIVTFKGTVSDEDNIRVNYQKNIKLKSGKYIVSSLNEKIVADFSVRKANDEFIYNNRIEIDGTEKEVKVRILFGLRPSVKGDVINETANIMLNNGDIVLPYEPYTGGIPSPSPDYPQEIKSVVNPTVKVTNEDGLKVQSVTLNNITLNAIPVSRGGNITIDGQQYIADYVDVEHRKVIRNILKWHLADIKSGFNNHSIWHMKITNLGIDGSKIGLSNMFKIQSSRYQTVTILELFIDFDGQFAALNMRGMTDEEFKKWIIAKNPEVYNVLTVAEEIPITLEEVLAFKQLMTYYPVTIIENNYNTWMKATYKSIESV